MLFMLFRAGNDDYAIAASEVEEVVPFARLKALPGTHPALAGLLNFRGRPVPVFDVNQLLGQPPVAIFFTTRILLCRNALAGYPEQLLGLVAENVVETGSFAATAFLPPGAAARDARHLGKIHEMAAGRYLQWIHPGQILTPEMIEELLAGMREAA